MISLAHKVLMSPQRKNNINNTNRDPVWQDDSLVLYRVAQVMDEQPPWLSSVVKCTDCSSSLLNGTSGSDTVSTPKACHHFHVQHTKDSSLKLTSKKVLTSKQWYKGWAEAQKQHASVVQWAHWYEVSRSSVVQAATHEELTFLQKIRQESDFCQLSPCFLSLCYSSRYLCTEGLPGETRDEKVSSQSAPLSSSSITSLKIIVTPHLGTHPSPPRTRYHPDPLQGQ